jgi:two-component system, chemotaxis family, chemotaxis protein CheY
MSLEKKIILIVDDMRTVRLKLKQICSELGIRHIYEAGDGLQALHVLEGVRADLVLSDWNMPNMTGIEMVEKIRQNPKLKDTPVIFITSESEREKILSSLVEGVSDYIVKPFLDKIVRDKICQLLNEPMNN